MASGPNFNPHRGTWYVQYRSNDGWHRKTVASAPPKWKPGDPVPKTPPEAIAARTHYEAIEREARARRRDGLPESLAEFLEAHVARYAKESTRQNVQAVVTQFLAYCAGRDIRHVPQVTTTVCGDWLDHLARTDAFSTVRRKRAQIGAAWSRLFQRGQIAANPWLRVAPPGKGPVIHRGSWTREEFARLQVAAQPWLRDVLVVGVNTGLRINALQRLEQGELLFARVAAVAQPSPTEGSARRVPRRGCQYQGRRTTTCDDPLGDGLCWDI